MLEIRGVSRRFGAVQALDDVTFTVQPGEVFGFVGSNGAGKTTTMRIVLGVLSADAGDVRWKGAPVDADLRRRIGGGVPVIFSSHQLELVERICDRIGIIAGGRMVAAGTVAELRERDTRVLVDVAGPPPGWAAGLPGVEVVAADAAGTRVRLAGGTDDQAVLHAALAAGPVHRFARVLPPLTELYRDVVQADLPEEKS